MDYIGQEPRFEVVYHLLSLTMNRRIRVKISTDEATPVPTVGAPMLAILAAPVTVRRPSCG